jgi:hypothetical protein
MIAPAVEPYSLEKSFPTPRTEMYSYEHYQNQMRPAYNPYPYYHYPANFSTEQDFNDKKSKRPVHPQVIAFGEEGEEEQRKRRFLEKNRLAGILLN